MLHVEARRWFQKTYGNTYHSVRIYKDGAQVYSSGMVYGYGDQWLQTALEWMERNGWPEIAGRYGTRLLREELGGSYSVIDVDRRRDL